MRPSGIAETSPLWEGVRQTPLKLILLGGTKYPNLSQSAKWSGASSDTDGPPVPGTEASVVDRHAWYVRGPQTSGRNKAGERETALGPSVCGGVLLMKRGVFFYEMVRHSKNWD